MKKFYIIFFLGLATFSYSQNFEIQAVLDNANDKLVIYMRNVSTAPNLPDVGESISTLSFQISGRTLLSAPVSQYGLQLPSTSGIVSIKPDGTTIQSPEAWPQNIWIDVVTYNTTPTASLVDFIITLDIDGDNADLNDPVMSVFNADGVNQSIIVQNTILPIRLQSFTAQKLGINSALLNWKSASEENASHFEIEKSMDAETWSKIGKEETRGSLNYGAEYSFRDEEALMIRNNENTVYYRLKMVDLDGSYIYSDIRLVTFDRNLGAADAYPNPSFEFFNWKMSVGDTQENDAQLHLFDMTGKLVKKQTVSANGISKVDIAELETGLYNIVVKHGDEVFRKRIIKTN